MALGRATRDDENGGGATPARSLTASLRWK